MEEPIEKEEIMKIALRTVSLSIVLLALLHAPSAMAQAEPSNPAMDKFKEDMKAAVLNGSITVPQVKELQANAETLKAAKGERLSGAPVDLLTPYRAVSSMKAIMAAVKQPDRETLQADMQALLAHQKTQAASVQPPNAGQKLGKDVFTAVMFGKPTEGQVKQLQDSLNGLEQAKADSAHPLKALMALKQSKGEIEAVMNSGSFRDQDRQAVLDDLNNLGPQGGGRHGRG
jgi:hypothetical protein